MTTGQRPQTCNYRLTLLTQTNPGTFGPATLGGGLYKLNITTGEVATFKTANSPLPSDYVESSLMTKDGKLYFGTSNSLSVFNPVSGQLQAYLNEKSNSNPSAENQTRSMRFPGRYDMTHAQRAKSDRPQPPPSSTSLARQNRAAFRAFRHRGQWRRDVGVEGSNLVNLKVDFVVRAASRSTPARMTAATACRTVSQSALAGKTPSGEKYFWGFHGVNRFLPSDIKIQFHKAQGDVLRFFIGQKRDIGSRGGRRRDGAQKRWNPEGRRSSATT